MDTQQAQQLLRQQISYAGILLTSSESEVRLPAQRAFMQGAIIGLGLGLECYVAQALGVAGFDAAHARASTANVMDDHSNAKRNELWALLDEGGWLHAFSRLYASTGLPPAAALVSGLDSTSGSAQASNATSEQSSQLIASSRPVPEQHWSQVHTDVIRDYLEKAEELLGRHSSADQEW